VKSSTPAIEPFIRLFGRYLRDQGLPVTQQREVIAEAVFSSEGHHSVDEIERELRERGERIGKATIYRTLDLLVKSKLVDEHDFGEGFKRYEHRLSSRPVHEHLICQECNKVVEFRSDEIREVEDRQSVALGNISGEFDSDGMWVGVQHLQLFLEEQAERDYELGYSSVAGMAMYFNYDAADEAVRNAFRDVNFRRAFSLGINRDEINFVSFNDLLTPRGWSWSPLSSYYDEEVANLWIAYDPDEANRLLDEAGYVDTNGDGFREAPDGSELRIIIDVSQHDLYVPINEMIRDQLGEIGLNIVLNVQHQDLIEERRLGKDWQIHVWDLYGTEEPLTNLTLWVPVSDGHPYWHQDASTAPFSPAFEKYTELLLEAPSLPFEARVAAIEEAGQIMADNVFGIYIGDYERPFIKSNRITNLPDRYARIQEFGSNQPAFRYHQTFGNWDRND